MSREAFEAWVNNPHKLNRRTEPGYTDEYEHPWTAGAWAGWQAALAWAYEDAARVCDELCADEFADFIRALAKETNL